MTDVAHMIFVGSPRLTSLSELKERNLYLSDIPLHDVTRELVLMNQQRIAEIEIRSVMGGGVEMNNDIHVMPTGK